MLDSWYKQYFTASMFACNECIIRIHYKKSNKNNMTEMIITKVYKHQEYIAYNRHK